jgi:DNA-binding HxlR family transcriptional regulator
MKPAKSSSSSPFEYWTPGTPMMPTVPIEACPIKTSLGVLGRKWTMLILRDMSMRNFQRFSELLRSIDGITPRILSVRLKEMQTEGLIRKSDASGPSMVQWVLTEKGSDALPILMSLFAFGSKWYAEKVFADGEPREISQIYPQRNLRESYVNLPLESQKKK